MAKVKTLTTTVSKLTGQLDALVGTGSAVPCTPGVEYQSGKDKDGKALCKYLTRPCDVFTNPRYFEKAAATRTSDRVCAQYTPFPAGSFLVVTGGAFKDNVYKKLKVCAKGKEFESTAGTRTSDRQCKAVTDCKKAGKVVVQPATATSDNECASKGQSAKEPARDCREIKELYAKLKSGYFYVDAKGAGVRKVWCDQQHQGGGWMLVGCVFTPRHRPCAACATPTVAADRGAPPCCLRPRSAARRSRLEPPPGAAVLLAIHASWGAGARTCTGTCNR